MRPDPVSARRYRAKLVVAAALLFAACSSDGRGGADAGGGNAAGGAGGGGGTGGASCQDAGTNACPCALPTNGSQCGVVNQVCDFGAVSCDCWLIPQQTGMAIWRCGPDGTGGTGGTTGTGGGGATGTGGAGGAGGATGTAGRGGTAGGTGGAAGGKAGTGGATGGSGLLGVAGTGGGKAGTGGNAGLCGGGVTCSDTQYCEWRGNQCGQGVLASGACTARPQGCGAVFEPVCGCDGQVYSNACMAAVAGQDSNDWGTGCKPPSGTFACGSRFCAQGTQYCQGTTGGVADTGGMYLCNQLPAACGATPTCACLAGTTECGHNCVMSADGDLTARCLLPTSTPL